MENMYQYKTVKVIKTNEGYQDKLQEILTEESNQGWRLKQIDTTTSPTYTFLIFERNNKQLLKG